MIDISADVFDAVAKAIRPAFPGIFITSKREETTGVFPALSVVETDNSVYEKTRDSGRIENHANVMYEINAYSSQRVGAEAECKEILSAVDDVLSELGFVRTFAGPTPNFNDPSITRRTARYTAVVDRSKNLFRR